MDKTTWYLNETDVNEKDQNNVTKNADDGYKSRPVVKKRETTVCTPVGTIHRFIVAIFICFINFGNYFIYDNPSALQIIIVKIIGINDEQFGLLYSVHAWLSVIFALFGGYLTDSLFGIRWASIIFSVIISIGQLILAVAAYVDLFWLMVFGRLVCAIGAENITIVQSVFIVKWFKGKELSTVFGIQLSFAKSASTLSHFVMLPIYNAIGPYFAHNDNSKVLGITFFIAFLTCLLSLGFTVALCWFDKRRDSYLDVQYKTEHNIENSSLNSFKQTTISMKDILHFPFSFWLLSIVCMLFYCSVDPFVSFGQLYFVNKFNLTPYQGIVCDGLVGFISIFGLVVCGLLIEFFGRNVQFIVISIFMILFCHCLLAFSFWSPYIATVILGCAYSLMASALWPAVAYIVPERATGTAYGVMLSLMNLGFAVWYMVIGVIVNRNGYLVLELIFILGLSLALTLSILLFFADSHKEGYLIMDGKKRKQLLSMHLEPTNVENSLSDDRPSAAVETFEEQIVPKSLFPVKRENADEDKIHNRRPGRSNHSLRSLEHSHH